MAMEFVFSSSDYDGMTAELYNATVVFPFPIPVAFATVSNGRVSFAVSAFNDFALRVQDGTTFLRSGVQELSLGEVDSNGDFSITYLVMRLTDPADTVISTATLAGGISLPISQDGLTVSTMTLSTVGGNMRATGSASYSAGILGTIPVNYTYDFSLEPVTSALSSRLINVETVNTSVTGAVGGLLGWIVNIIVSIIALIFKGRIADSSEDEVQNQVDEAVENQFASSGAPDGTMATLRSVSVSGGNITIEPFVLVPLAALGCPFMISSGSIKVRDRRQLRKLRAMRDRALSRSPQGEAYIALLRQHAPELVRLLAANPRLLKQADALIRRGLEEFDEEAPEKGVLSKESATAAKELMKALASDKNASRDLRQTIERTLPDVDEFTGRPVREVLESSNEKLRKLTGK